MSRKKRNNGVGRPDLKRWYWQLSPFCVYCGRQMTLEEATLDHRHPRSKGGKSGKHNLCLCCLPCNVAKGSMSEAEFRRTLK